MNANLAQNPWVSLASCFRAWAVEQLGNGHDGAQQLRQSIELWKQTGAEFFLPLLGAMLAETCIACDDLEEAVAIVDEELSRLERTGQDQWRSMVLWTKGDALLAMNLSDQAEAERCYLEAIDFTRSQSAKSWELRAATRLARLWHSQGKTAEARDLLAPVYGWFTEGLDTADPRDAKALLDELA